MSGVFPCGSLPYLWTPLLSPELTEWLDWLTSWVQWSSSAVFPVVGLQTFVTTLGFHVDAWDSNSSPYACDTGSLLTKPFSSALDKWASKGNVYPREKRCKPKRIVIILLEQYGVNTSQCFANSHHAHNCVFLAVLSLSCQGEWKSVSMVECSAVSMYAVDTPPN